MIWVIGSKDMLGREITSLLNEMKIPHSGTDLDVDILSPGELEMHADTIKPTWIINCAAYTALDKAEDEVEQAFLINKGGSANIATLAQSLDIPLIHISTDCVFDGTSTLPLTEDDKPSPLGVYGASKLAGELEIQKITQKYFILRTSWLYGRYGKNFVYTMLNEMNEKPSLNVVNDQIGSPTWTRDLASLILTIISRKSRAYGIYNYTGEDQCSWWEFAWQINSFGTRTGLIDSLCSVFPCTSEQYITRAKRPAFSLLSKEKVKREYGITIPTWDESLKTFMKSLTPEYISSYVS